jgi:hypothetical protein
MSYQKDYAHFQETGLQAYILLHAYSSLDIFIYFLNLLLFVCIYCSLTSVKEDYIYILYIYMYI